eukprot:Opistho-2@46137
MDAPGPALPAYAAEALNPAVSVSSSADASAIELGTRTSVPSVSGNAVPPPSGVVAAPTTHPAQKRGTLSGKRTSGSALSPAPIRPSLSTSDLAAISAAGSETPAVAPLKRHSSLTDIANGKVAIGHQDSVGDLSSMLAPPDRAKSTSMSCIVPGEAAFRERTSSRSRGLAREPCILLDIALMSDAATGTRKLTVGVVEAKDIRAHLTTPLEDPYVELCLHLNSNSQKGSRTRGGSVPRQSSSPFIQYSAKTEKDVQPRQTTSATPRNQGSRDREPSVPIVPIVMIDCPDTERTDDQLVTGAQVGMTLPLSPQRTSIPLKDGDGSSSRPRSNSYAQAITTKQQHPNSPGMAADGMRRGTGASSSSSSNGAGQQCAGEGEGDMDGRPEVVWKESMDLVWMDSETSNAKATRTEAISQAVTEKFTSMSKQFPFLQVSLF